MILIRCGFLFIVLAALTWFLYDRMMYSGVRESDARLEKSMQRYMRDLEAKGERNCSDLEVNFKGAMQDYLQGSRSSHKKRASFRGDFIR